MMIAETDNAQRLAAEDANFAFLSALHTGRGPDAFVWHGIAGAFTNNPDRTYDLDAVHAKEAKAESLRVDRDACTYCGVRRDIGCKHSIRWAA